MGILHERKRLVRDLDLTPFRPIRACTNIGTNYVYHVLAVARIGFESEYADRYTATVAAQDVACLRAHKSHLSFGNGSAGVLCDVVYGLPLLLELNSPAAFQTYYATIDRAIADRDFTVLSRQFDLRPERFYPFFLIDVEDFAAILEYRDAIRSLGNVFVRNWETYEAEVWPCEQPALSDVASRIDAAFADRDLVSDWERLTGAVYSRTGFSVELCSSIKNGPNANSITCGRVVFYSGTPFEWMIDFISHEIGIHTLFQNFRELYESGGHSPTLLYHANESLAMFLNRRLLGREPQYHLPQAFCEQSYCDFFDRSLLAAPSLSARDLLAAAVRDVAL
jgi:hypothetical protein